MADPFGSGRHPGALSWFMTAWALASSASRAATCGAGGETNHPEGLDLGGYMIPHPKKGVKKLVTQNGTLANGNKRIEPA